MLGRKLQEASSAYPTTQYVGGFAEGFVGSTSNITISLTSLTGGIASAPAEGDLVVVYFGVGSNTVRVPSVPVSYTGISVSGYQNVAALSATDTYRANLIVSYKFMGSTPDTSFVLTDGTNSVDDAGAVAVHVFRNVDPLLPLDVAVATATGANTGVPNPPAITPTTQNAVIVSGAAAAHIGGVLTFTSSDLTDFVTAGGNDTRDVTIGAGYYDWDAGAFDPAQFGGGTTANTSSWAAVTLALRPNQDKPTPEFIASAQRQNASTSANLTIDKPAGTLEGDLMVAFLAAGGGDWGHPSGWTEVGDTNGYAVSYKVAGASEPSSYTFSLSSSLFRLSGAIVTYRDAAYDAIGSFATPDDVLVVTGPSAAEDYSRLLGFAAWGSGTLTVKSNMVTQRVLDNGSTGPSWYVGDDVVLEGATGTRTFYADSATNGNGVLLTIKPA